MKEEKTPTKGREEGTASKLPSQAVQFKKAGREWVRRGETRGGRERRSSSSVRFRVGEG